MTRSIEPLEDAYELGANLPVRGHTALRDSS